MLVSSKILPNLRFKTSIVMLLLGVLSYAYVISGIIVSRDFHRDLNQSEMSDYQNLVKLPLDQSILEAVKTLMQRSEVSGVSVSRFENGHQKFSILTTRDGMGEVWAPPLVLSGYHIKVAYASRADGGFQAKILIFLVAGSIFLSFGILNFFNLPSQIGYSSSEPSTNAIRLSNPKATAEPLLSIENTEQDPYCYRIAVAYDLLPKSDRYAKPNSEDVRHLSLVREVSKKD